MSQTVFFILAGAALVVAFAVRSIKPEKTAASWGAFGAGVVLAVAGLVVPRLSSASDVSLRIVSPRDGATVEGDSVRVQVAVEGGELASSAADTGGHLHIFIDGVITQMPYGDGTKVKLSPGRHEIAVEYVDAQHAGLDPPVKEAVRVTAE